jgi:pimeloyl-ACP methyl ester carboxylesterase
VAEVGVPVHRGDELGAICGGFGGAQSRGLFAGQRWSPAGQHDEVVGGGGAGRAVGERRGVADGGCAGLPPAPGGGHRLAYDLLALGAEAEEPFRRRYDHRDTGRSVSYPPGAPGYTGPDLVGDAVGLIDALAGGRAHVVGLSMGGGIAQYLAVEHPDRVATLTRRVVNRTVNLESSAKNHWLVEGGEDTRPRLGEVTAPTLVIHGTEDPSFPSGHAIALAREIAGAERLLLDGVGHQAPPRSTWALVVPAILRHTAP